jgi:hypothetical protein
MQQRFESYQRQLTAQQIAIALLLSLCGALLVACHHLARPHAASLPNDILSILFFACSSCYISFGSSWSKWAAVSLAATALAFGGTAVVRILLPLWKIAPLVAPEVCLFYVLGLSILSTRRGDGWEPSRQEDLALRVCLCVSGVWNAAATINLAWKLFITGTKRPVLWRLVASSGAFGSYAGEFADNVFQLPGFVQKFCNAILPVAFYIGTIFSWICPYIHIHVFHCLQELTWDIWKIVQPCMLLFAKWDDSFVLLVWLGYFSEGSSDNQGYVMRSQKIFYLVSCLLPMVGLAGNILSMMSAGVFDITSTHVLWRVLILSGLLLLALATCLGGRLQSTAGWIRQDCEFAGWVVFLVGQTIMLSVWVLSSWNQQCAVVPGA